MAGQDLVAFGPGVICFGELRGADASGWSIRVRRFVDGDRGSLIAFIDKFEQTPVYDRYVVANVLGDGRVLSKAPALTGDNDGDLVTCAVSPPFPRTAVHQLPTDYALDIKTNDLYADKRGNIARVSGLEALPQTLRRCLSTQRGESPLHADFGVRIADYFEKFHDAPWLAQLVKLEVIRQAAIPYHDMIHNKVYTPLLCVERVWAVDLLASAPQRSWLPIRVDLEIRGFGRRQDELSICVPSAASLAQIRAKQETYSALALSSLKAGAPTSPPQTIHPSRRLTVIFVADIVGYTRHMARDEVEAVARVRKFEKNVLEPLLPKYEGRIFNTAGDSFLMEFRSAVQAIECWVEALAQLRDLQAHLPVDQRFRFRAGIHLGEVLVQGENLLGEEVIMATRLLTLAQPDGLCASTSAFHQVAKRIGSIVFKSSGPHSVKNDPDPVNVYVAVFGPELTGNPVMKHENQLNMPGRRTSSSAAPPILPLPTSPRSAELLMALARSCPDGLGRKNFYKEDIQGMLPHASPAEIEDLVHELEAEDLGKLAKAFGGSWHLRLTQQFYVQVDPRAMGWSPADDGRSLAGQMLAEETGRAADLHRASGWERRRFNPAFRYVMDRMPINFVNRERSPEYPAVSILMQPEARASLRRLARSPG